MEKERMVMERYFGQQIVFFIDMRIWDRILEFMKKLDLVVRIY